MTIDVTVEVCDRDRLAQMRDAWLDLAGRCLEPSIFADPGFLLAAARHLARPPGPRFVAVWRHAPGRLATLVGLCPIAPRRLPGLYAAVWTHPQATAAYPMLDHKHAASTLAALLASLRRSSAAPAALLLSGLVADGATARLIDASGHPVAILDERSRAVLRPDGTASALSAKTRRELRRQWNRLATQGPLEFRSAASPEAIENALDDFLRLERAGWKGARGTALASTASTLHFAHEAVRDLGSRGQVRIDWLESAGRVIAGGVVLRAGDRAFFWKTAYDETLASSSPGLQLALQLTTKQQAEPGLNFTDSCAVPGHSMIDRIWPDRMIVVDALVSTSPEPSLAFRLACTLERQRRRLRRSAKMLLAQASSLRRR